MVKLLGKNIGYHMMNERLQHIWKTAIGLEIMDINNGYYILIKERVCFKLYLYIFRNKVIEICIPMFVTNLLNYRLNFILGPLSFTFVTNSSFKLFL